MKIGAPMRPRSHGRLQPADDAAPLPNEILDEEEYISRRVLPCRGDSALTAELLQILDEARHDGIAPRIHSEWGSAVHPAVSGLRGEIVRCNLRLAFGWARSLKGRRESMTIADRFQAGTLGLFRAATKFDRTRGGDFSAYATRWIQQSLSRSVDNDDRFIRLPAHLWAKEARPDRQVPKTISLSEVPRKLLDDLVAHESGEAVQRELSQIELQDAIGTFLRSARRREALVLRLRWGLSGSAELTLEQIGRRLGVTRERIRQIEERALERLAFHLRKAWGEECPARRAVHGQRVQR
jgi:RNA polymerase sigma factor (sigma-70 family)